MAPWATSGCEPGDDEGDFSIKSGRDLICPALWFRLAKALCGWAAPHALRVRFDSSRASSQILFGLSDTGSRDVRWPGRGELEKDVAECRKFFCFYSVRGYHILERSIHILPVPTTYFLPRSPGRENTVKGKQQPQKDYRTVLSLGARPPIPPPSQTTPPNGTGKLQTL